MAKKAKQDNKEKPLSFNKYNIRISSPYGAYPDDVDKTILQLEEKIAEQKVDIVTLSDANAKLVKELNDAKKQIAQLKLAITNSPMDSIDTLVDNILATSDLLNTELIDSSNDVVKLKL